MTFCMKSLRLRMLLVILLLIGLSAPGRADLLWQNRKTGDVAFWITNGAAYSSYVSVAHGLPASFEIVGMADLDLDGSQDIVWRDNATGDITYWLMNGAVELSGGVLARKVGLDWKIVGLADIDGDGYTDLLFQNTKTGDVSYWLLNGTTVASAGFIAHAVAPQWQITGTADADGTGNISLLWQNSKTNEIATWTLSGTVVQGGYVWAQGVPPVWRIVGTQMLNGDTNPSLLWQNTQTGEAGYWFTVATQNQYQLLTGGNIAPPVGSDWRIVAAPPVQFNVVTVNDAAMPFARTDINGTLRHLPDDYRHKVVMLDFWATWCGPCVAELPFITAAYAKYHSQGFEILGISLDDANMLSELKTFLTSNNMTWPQIYDGGEWSAQIAMMWNITSIPHAYLIDGNTGKIIAEGDAIRGKALDPAIAAALKGLK